MVSFISGHKLTTVEKILETYMPRTDKMAGRAIVAKLADRRPAPAANQEEQA